MATVGLGVHGRPFADMAKGCGTIPCAQASGARAAGARASHRQRRIARREGAALSRAGAVQVGSRPQIDLRCASSLLLCSSPSRRPFRRRSPPRRRWRSPCSTVAKVSVAARCALPTTGPSHCVRRSASPRHHISQHVTCLLASQATRDPAPTVIDPNDPKGKQQAIHKAESFAEYLAKREAAS